MRNIAKAVKKLEASHRLLPSQEQSKAILEDRLKSGVINNYSTKIGKGIDSCVNNNKIVIFSGVIIMPDRALILDPIEELFK